MLGQLTQLNVKRPADVTGLILVALPHIDDQRLRRMAGQLLQILQVYLVSALQRLAGLLPGLQTAVQVAIETVVTDADELPGLDFSAGNILTPAME